MKLIIGNKNYSSWSLRAWLAAREGGFTFEEIRISLFIPGSRERILSHSPAGKVPCLNDHGVVVWAVARAVTAEMHSGFQNLRSRMPMNVRKDYTGFGHSPEVDADIARIVAIWNDCRARFGAEGPYLFGRFSLADAAFAPVAFRFQTYAVKPEGAAGDYLATLLANPHMQEWAAAARAESESIPEEDLYG